MEFGLPEEKTRWVQIKLRWSFLGIGMEASSEWRGKKRESIREERKTNKGAQG
jgi:hypothetical protein